MFGVAEVGLLYGDRVWFTDARSPFRRLAVSSHPESGVVILSLWTGDTCTGTFRVPMADAAGLIATLAEGMAQSIPRASGPTLAAEPARPAWRDLVARLFARIRGGVTGT
jgi:hypothetical protein